MEISTLISEKQAILVYGDLDINDIKKSLKVSDADTLIILEEHKIANIRELSKFLSLKPYNSPLKLAIILKAENLNAEASNALLKTLEEPPSYGRIILQTENEHKILPTIISRCLRIRLPFNPKLVEPNNYRAPQELKKLPLVDRFKWASSIEDKVEVDQILTLWQAEFRNKLLAGDPVLPILKDLEKAKDLLQTNISVKLLLENLCIKFDEC